MRNNFSINSREIVQIAQFLCPGKKKLTRIDRNLALLYVRFRTALQKEECPKGLFTYTQSAQMFKPVEYKNGTSAERKGIVSAVKNLSKRLADMSSEGRGNLAFCLVPVNKLAFDDDVISNPPHTVEAAKPYVTTFSGMRQHGFYIGTDPNGEIPLAWTERNKNNADGKKSVNEKRQDGWNAAGLLSDASLAQIGAPSLARLAENNPDSTT